MSGHTPGPWTLCPHFGDPVVGIDCHDGGGLLPIVYKTSGADLEEAEANARLISAAPCMKPFVELIATLGLPEDLYELDPGDSPDSDWREARITLGQIREARRVLAKATKP